MSLETRLVERIEKLISKGDRLIKVELSEQDLEQYRRAVGANLVDDFYDPLDEVEVDDFIAWRTQVLVFLSNVLGENHLYFRQYESHVGAEFADKYRVKLGQNILKAVREDIEDGYLTDVRTLVSAEVFADFLEMAEHLLEAGYVHPAASLTGAVLENGLRRIATRNSIKVKAREDLSSLNHKCANAEVYNRLVQKKLEVIIGIRNSADHGKFDEYSEEDVSDMVRGVKMFLGDYLESSPTTPGDEDRSD